MQRSQYNNNGSLALVKKFLEDDGTGNPQIQLYYEFIFDNDNNLISRTQNNLNTNNEWFVYGKIDFGVDKEFLYNEAQFPENIDFPMQEGFSFYNRRSYTDNYSSNSQQELIHSSRVIYYYSDEQTSIKDNVANTSTLVYPNPASNVIHFSNELDPRDKIEVYAVTGQLVLSATPSQSNSIEISGLEPGTYLLQIKGKSKAKKGVFIKR